MRVLVIGGTQFMGRAIAERLVAAGHDVSVLHRRANHDLGPAVRNLQADRGDLPTVTALLARERFEAVFDLAFDWQHGTTASQVEAAARACGDRLERYVFMSSIAAYGPGLDHREDDALVPDDAPDAYAGGKAAAERALFRMHEAEGFPVVTFRPPFVHGPGQPFYREQFFWDRLLERRPIILPEDADAPIQWAFALDVAHACIEALKRPGAVGQAFNVAHVEPTTRRTFVEALARTAGVAPHLVPVRRGSIESCGGQLVGENLYFGEFLDLPPFTEVVDKARRVLDFSPTALDEALAISFAWYAAQPRRRVDYAFEDRLLALG